jgi:hypothetical protein
MNVNETQIKIEKLGAKWDQYYRDMVTTIVEWVLKVKTKNNIEIECDYPRNDHKLVFRKKGKRENFFLIQPDKNEPVFEYFRIDRNDLKPIDPQQNIWFYTLDSYLHNVTIQVIAADIKQSYSNRFHSDEILDPLP